jgi:cytidine deaminase
MVSEETTKKLVRLATEARKNAYARYSNYQVGAALLTKSGQIFTGANVENAVFPLTICAERSAVVSAVTAGETEFSAISVVTRDAGTPCGSCRQVLSEFGLDIEVIIADDQGKIHQVTTVGDLLPHSFSQENLDSSR